MTYAIITGASKGIGKAIAYELAKRKINLLLIARTEDLLIDLAHDLGNNYSIDVDYFLADLADPTSAQQIADWCIINQYEIQYLVNNAGYGLSGSFDRYRLKEYLENMQVNMNMVVQLTYLFLPDLKKQKKGYILNIASSAAYQAIPYLSVYAATKSFVLQFSRALHHELKKTNVSVTCISPGATDTNFADRAQVGERGLKLANKVNMKPEDVAKIAVDAMFKGKMEVVTGFINKLGVFMAWLLPKRMVEKTSSRIYQ
jgi:short-subunit dehydrogenase